MNITEILSNSEPDNYGDSIVSLDSENREIFVISDLHMAAGINSNGNYDGTENFFADKSLSRFLGFLRKTKRFDKKGLLIINGDFIDFLRIRNRPATPKDFEDWSDILKSLGIDKNVDTLRASITNKELTYGLRTDDFKSVYKLSICYQGHPAVFRCLTSWLEEGNDLLIVKGNHDLEWYWKLVRDYLRLLLAKNISISPQQIRFVDDKLIIDKKIYIEHGHHYENFTNVNGDPLMPGGKELNLPFGSFFNRYLINRIELAYPFIDDVRPRENILPLLIRERFPLAIRLLFRYIPFLLLVIPKKQYRFALRFFLQFVWIIVLPILITAVAVYLSIPHPVHLIPAKFSSSGSSSIWTTILSPLKNLLFLSLSYFMGRLFSILELSAPTSFYPNAQAVFKIYPEIELVTFGHTHDPEQKKSGGKSYYNTGTWIPVFELDAADVRLDKTYTFLQISRDPANGIHTEGLMRWNDDAGRSDGMQLRDSI
jgi:UDP-2,3-diacylglucosamine pyrophosphatase LpxH